MQLLGARDIEAGDAGSTPIIKAIDVRERVNSDDFLELTTVDDSPEVPEERVREERKEEVEGGED